MKKNPTTMMYDIVQPTTLKGVPSVTITTSWQRVVRSISVESSDSESGLLVSNVFFLFLLKGFMINICMDITSDGE